MHHPLGRMVVCFARLCAVGKKEWGPRLYKEEEVGKADFFFNQGLSKGPHRHQGQHGG